MEDRTGVDEGLRTGSIVDVGGVEEVAGFLGIGGELIVPGYDLGLLGMAAHGWVMRSE